MKSLQLLAALGIAMTGSGAAQAARCNPDTVSTGGFESVSGVRITGEMVPLRAGTIEVRHGANVLVSATLDVDNFFFDLPPVAPEALIELRARGNAEAGEDFIELASYVGTAQQLIDEAGSNGYAGVGNTPTLALTPESTARYAMIRSDLNGAAPVHECELAAKSAALDEAEVRERTAVIKLMIENGGTSSTTRSKGGAGSTTLDTVADDALLQSEIAAIETAQPGALAALVAVLSESFCDYFQPEAKLVLSHAEDRLNSFSDNLFESFNGTQGRHSDRFGGDMYTYSCSGDVFDADLAGTRISVGFPVRIVDGQARQVREETATDRIRLTRLDSAVGEVTVGVYQEVRRHFPFEPSLPDEVSTTSGGRLDLIRQRSGTAFSAVDLEGSEYLMPTRLELLNSNALDFEYERLSFASGGAGQGLDVGQSFTWQVNGSGELLLDFASRDLRLIPLRDEPGAQSVLVVLDRSDGSRAVNTGWSIQRDPAVAWPAVAAMPASYVQHAGRVYTDEFTGPFRWDFALDRSAPAISTTTAGDSVGSILYWSQPDAENIVLRLCSGGDGTGGVVEKAIINRDPLSGECGTRYRQRNWTILRRSAAVGGEYIWVLEHNRDWYSTDPMIGGLDQPQFSFYRGIMYQQRPLPELNSKGSTGSDQAVLDPASLHWHAPMQVR